MKTKAKANARPLIGLIERNDPFAPACRLIPHCNDLHDPGFAFSVRIARLASPEETGNPGPRNWSRSYDEPKNSTGGCSGRIFATKWETEPARAIFGYYGPEYVTGGSLADYVHGVRALTRIERELARIQGSRGPARDAAEEMGRFLEAAGVSEVWFDERKISSGWLTDGDWQAIPVGELIRRVREHILPVTTEPAEAAAGSA